MLRNATFFSLIKSTGKLTCALRGTPWLRSIHQSREVPGLTQPSPVIILFSHPLSEIEGTISLSSAGLCLWRPRGAPKRTAAERDELGFKYPQNGGSIKSWRSRKAVLQTFHGSHLFQVFKLTHLVICLMFYSIASPEATLGAAHHDTQRDTSILRLQTNKPVRKLKFK